MTTIILSERLKRNGGKYQVFGKYEGTDDRFVFGAKSFDLKSDAERAAARMMETAQADHFERVTGD